MSNEFRFDPDTYDPTAQEIIIKFNDDDTPTVEILGRVVWYRLPLQDCI